VRYGSEAQKREWLVPLLEGRVPFRLRDEPSPGGVLRRHNIAPASPATADHYVINGRK